MMVLIFIGERRFVMTSTLENKARFFAQYFGQEVRIWYHLPHNKCKVSNKSLSSESVKESYLSLKPLTQISDEDAMKVAELAFGHSKYNKNIKLTQSLTKNFGFSFYHNSINNAH